VARPNVAVTRPTKPDTLVDPNLLPPPPPRAKPKPQQIAVVCKLCGTRTHAPLDKAGKEIKCPDCHSSIAVPRPQTAALAKAKAPGPTLDDVEDFGLSQVIERPKYQPLVAPRGNEVELAGADSPKAASPGTASRPAPPRRVLVEPVDDEAAAEDDEVVLEPPAERPDLVRDPRSILPNPDLEPPDPMYDGRYEGGAIGDGVDPRSPDAWKRAPLVYGILGFVLMPSTLLRLLFFGVWLGAVALVARLAIFYSQADDNQQILALFVMWGGIPMGAAWVFSFSSAIQAVVEATANGENEVTQWPDWNVFEWFAAARFVLVASFVAGLPGAIVGAATLAASMDDPAMAIFGIAAPPVLSWLVLFPVIHYSMLVEDNMLAILSGQALRNLKAASDGWMFVYMYSFMISIAIAFTAGMLITGSFLVALLGGAGLVALLLLYARIVGRLMWYAGQQAEIAQRRQAASIRSQAAS
jgi:hypothetical protein